MMRKGFMLIEVVIGTMIASMIGMVLMNSLQQMIKVIAVVDEKHTMIHDMFMIQQYLERDLRGLCIPAEGRIAQKKSTAQAAPATQSPQKEQASPAQPHTPSLKKLFFVSIGETNQQMQQLTFITNNPVPRYSPKATKESTAKGARVMYFLQPEKEHPGAFTLMRKEQSSTLEFESITQDTVKAYAIAPRIHSFMLTLTYETKSNEQKNEHSSAAKTAARIATWDSDELLKGKTEYVSLLPTTISISLTLWNSTYTHTTPFTLYIPIIAEGFNALIAPEQKKNEPPSSASTPASPDKRMETSMRTIERTMQKLDDKLFSNIRVASDAPPKKKRYAVDRPLLPMHLPGVPFIK